MKRIETRSQLLAAVTNALGDRKLGFFGTRGTDALPLIEIPQFSFLFTQISPLESVGAYTEHCLEGLSGCRQDLDTYSVDTDKTPAIEEYRCHALQALETRCAIVTYRPTQLLTDVLYPRTETALYLGMFHGQQMAFEYKAWVETELARYGVQTLPWRYCSDSQKCLLDEAMDVQLVVRANRTDGGAGVALYDRRNGVLPPHDDRFVAVAPFLDGAIPLNVNGCVFPNGEVTVHGPSFQLIGLPTCSVRRFGYCGNDFAAFAQLDGRTVDAVEAMTLSAGRWLHSKGYCGAFGIDALLLGGLLYMAEVNPRFQGSSCLAAQLDAWLDIPDQYLCHLAAFLGITCPLRPRLRDVVVRQRRRAHVVVHNTSQEAMILDDSSAEMECRVHQLPGKTVRVLPDAILAELVLADQVTRDGFSVDTRTLRVVLGVKAHYRNAPT